MTAQTASRIPTRSDRALLAYVHSGFVLAGAVSVLLGPILPFLAARWSLTDSQTGKFFLAQFFGAIVGVSISSFTLPRRGYRISFLFGLAMISLGLATMGRGTFEAALASIFCFGAGLGLHSASTNLWVGEVKDSTRAGSLNLVNFSWTVGAMACPLLVLLFTVHGGLSGLLWTLAAFSAFLALASFAIPLDRPRAGSSGNTPRNPHSRSLVRDPATYLFAAIFFFQLGTENAVGGWLATYSKRILASNSAAWTITPSIFWGGLALGRALAPSVLKRLSELRLVHLGLLLSMLGTFIWLASATASGIFTGALISGLGLAAVFPILMSWLVAHSGVQARRIGGQMLGIGILGGAILPWLIGILSTHFASLRAGISIIFLVLAFNFFLFSVVSRLLRSRDSAPGS
jgi:fucose permease